MLSILFMFICSLNQAVTKVHYITPSSDGHCVKPCLTLSELASNSGHYIRSNTTLVFNPGIHQLGLNLTVSNTNRLLITSTGLHTQVVCRRCAYINLSWFQSVHVSNVKFLGCGGVIRGVGTIVLRSSIFEGQNNSGTSLRLIKTSAVIINCTFKFNTNGSHQAYKMNDCSNEYMYTVKPSSWTYLLSDYVWAGGAVVAVDSNASFSRCTFENNRAEFGGAMFVIRSYITINATTFFKNQAGSKLLVRKAKYNNLTFAGVIYQEKSRVDISNCRFLNNSANVGGVIFSLKGALNIRSQIFVKMQLHLGAYSTQIAAVSQCTITLS